MGTWTINPDDLTATRAGLGVAIGTDVLSPNGSAANLTNLPADLSGDIRNVALGSAADRITLLNGIVDPLTDESDVNAGTITFEGGTATAGNTHHGDAAWVAQRFTASQSGLCTGIRMAVAGSHFTSGCEIRLETSDGTTTPTGTLVDSNATLTTTGNVLETAADVFVTLNFATPFAVVKDTVYWIVVSRSDSSSYGLYRIASGAVTGTGVSLAGSFQSAYEMSIKAVIVPGDSINQTFTSGSGGYYSKTSGAGMTLISNAYTATSAPSNAVLGFQTVENEAATINTDIKGFVSRDGGSNFTEVTLALKTTLGQTGTKYYECAETTLTSTSGSSMVWKITTHNTKDIQVHGVALSWS